MENSQITLSFASISGRKIEADFDGGTTTSDGGALLLRQAESKIGIVDRIVGALCDRRHQSYILPRLVDYRLAANHGPPRMETSTTRMIPRTVHSNSRCSTPTMTSIATCRSISTKGRRAS